VGPENGADDANATGGADGPGGAIAFGEKLLGLLDTGSFTTSYKYALLLAILDETLERTRPDGSPPIELSARALGRRVFALYWQQARPFSDAGPLRQSGTRDAVVKLAALRDELGLPQQVSVDEARRRHPIAVRGLERDVVATVVRYPVPLLQRFVTGSQYVEERFIYEVPWSEHVTPARVHRDDFDDRLRLVPGAGEALTALSGLVRPVIQREWLRHVARRNDDQVDELRLEAFLFGGQRVSLAAVTDPLLELQGGRCFYCDRVRGRFEVDHFLPWSRLPDDRLDNLVVAHADCNHDKRAALAGLDHLDRWSSRFEPGSATDRRLAEVVTATRWPRRRARTAAGARGLYLHQPAGTMLWSGRREVEPLDAGRLREVLLAGPLAAEEPGTYDDG
jgi:5-methylcytosine-specific restriction endonuclease McrA